MLSRLLPLILGAFAIGTETFMISGVLPTIAADLRVSPATAGSLVTIFALAYAVGSPVLAVATADFERKRMLSVALGVFAIANVLAALAPSFFWLAAARVALALSAGAFMPAAVAFATAMHSPAQRGRAIALVYAGMTLATVVGVPAGTLVASLANWRATFLGVGALSAVAVLGVVAMLPRLGGVEAVRLRRAPRGRPPPGRAEAADAHHAGADWPVRRQHLPRRARRNDARGRGRIARRRPDDLRGAKPLRQPVRRLCRRSLAARALPRRDIRRSDCRLQRPLGGADPRRRSRSDGAIPGARALGRSSAGRSRSSSRRGSFRSTQNSPRSRLSLNTSALYIGAAFGSMVGAFAVGHWSVASRRLGGRAHRARRSGLARRHYRAAPRAGG